MTFQSCQNSANKDPRLFSALFLSVPLLFASACGGGGGGPPGIAQAGAAGIFCNFSSAFFENTLNAAKSISRLAIFLYLFLSHIAVV